MPNKKSGYTLIEILVGLTLISIIFGVGYVAFREFSRRQLILSASRTIKGDLRLAQAEAIAGTKPEKPNCADPSVLDGYNFTILPPNSYKIEAKCTLGVYEIKRVTLNDAVVLQTPSINPLFFKTLGQGNNIPTGTTVVISVSALGLTGNIKVTNGGVIE